MSRSIWRPAPQPRRKILAFRNAASFGFGYWRGIDAANSGVTTPDHASLDILGDLDLRALVNPDAGWGAAVDFVIIAKRETAGTSGQAYKFAHFQTAGNNFLSLAWNVNTTTEIVVNSTAETDPLTGAAWVRATLDVDNGAGGYEVKFYTSTDPIDTSPASVTWAQLGATITGGATTSIQNTTSPVTLGAYDLDDGGATRFAGRFHYAEIRNGINGTVVANPDFRWRTDYVSLTSLTDQAGRAWTIQSPAWWVLPLQTAEPLAAETYFQSVGGTITPAGALIREAQLRRAGTITPTATLIKEGQKKYAGTITPAGALQKKLFRSLAGTITPAGALTKKTRKTLIGTITPAGLLIKKLKRTFAASITPAGLLRRPGDLQTPDATVSNVGWDTGPSGGGDLDAAVVSNDSDYITVTV